MPRAAHARLALLVLAALAAGCPRTEKHGDSVEAIAAVVNAPLRAVLRVHEFDVTPECTETGLLRYRCFFRSEQQGCAWLELGPDRVAPSVPEDPEETGLLCTVLGDGPRVRRVANQPLPSRGVELVADSTGTRLAWRSGPTEAWAVFYVLDGAFLDDGSPVLYPVANIDEGAAGPGGQRPKLPSGPIDWAMIPTLGQKAADLLPSASGARLQKLIALVRDDRGDQGVAVALAGALPLYGDRAWKAAWNQLPPAARAAFHAEVVEQLEDEPNESALIALQEWPALRPPGYADLLARLASEQLDEGTASDSTLPLWLEALVQLGDPRAGPIACGWLEEFASRNLVNIDEYNPWEYQLAETEAALVAIARNRTACPWIRLILEQDPCAYTYRCSPKSLVQMSEAYELQEEAALDEAAERGLPEPPAEPQHALCSSAQVSRLVQAWSPPWFVPEGEPEPPADPDAFESPTPTGTFLLAAAWAQGPLPESVALRNRRRLYRVDDKTPRSTPDDELDSSACQFLDAALSNPAEIACHVPTSVTHLRLGGCRVDIDDARQVITLTPPKSELARDGGT